MAGIPQSEVVSETSSQENPSLTMLISAFDGSLTGPTVDEWLDDAWLALVEEFPTATEQQRTIMLMSQLPVSTRMQLMMNEPAPTVSIIEQTLKQHYPTENWVARYTQLLAKGDLIEHDMPSFSAQRLCIRVWRLLGSTNDNARKIMRHLAAVFAYVFVQATAQVPIMKSSSVTFVDDLDKFFKKLESAKSYVSRLQSLARDSEYQNRKRIAKEANMLADD